MGPDEAQQVKSSRAFNWRRGVWRVWLVLWVGLLLLQTFDALSEWMNSYAYHHVTPHEACGGLPPSAIWIAEEKERHAASLSSEPLSVDRVYAEALDEKEIRKNPSYWEETYARAVEVRAKVCDEFVNKHALRFTIVVIVPWAALYLVWFVVWPGLVRFARWIRDGFTG